MKRVRDYIFGAFEEKLWVSIGDEEKLKHSGENPGAGRDFVSYLQNAVGAFIAGHSDAWRILGRAESLRGCDQKSGK